MRCPQCNYDNADNARFCAHCGAKLVETRVQVFRKPGSFHVGLRDAYTGETIIEPKYYEINGLGASNTPKTLTNQKLFIASCDLSLKDDSSKTVYDDNGNIIIPGGIFTYIWHLPWLSMFVCIAWGSKLHEECGYYAYDEQGNRLFKYKFVNVSCPNEGFIVAAENFDRLYGYIDIQTGEPILEFKWKEALNFKNGYALVKDPQTKKWGLINTRGEVVVPCEYHDLIIFDDGKVKYKKHWYSFDDNYTTLTDLLNKYK